MSVLSGSVYDFQFKGSPGPECQGGSDRDLSSERGGGEPLHDDAQDWPRCGEYYAGADCGHQCGDSRESAPAKPGYGGYRGRHIGYCGLYGRKRDGLYDGDRGGR